MRREFTVRLIGTLTLLVVSYLPYGIYTSMQIKYNISLHRNV